MALFFDQIETQVDSLEGNLRNRAQKSTRWTCISVQQTSRRCCERGAETQPISAQHLVECTKFANQLVRYYINGYNVCQNLPHNLTVEPTLQPPLSALAYFVYISKKTGGSFPMSGGA